ncbi:MAG: hypothetical protein K9M99_07745 [Candidatus Cloacimonetes bacterium]|nr:hypothetical protein [Candidatus Cloacimonadota bacterium]
MEHKIIDAISEPEILEKLYRKDRQGFILAFNKVTSDLASTDLIRFWQIRLQSPPQQKVDFTPLFVSLILVVFLTWIPQIFHFSSAQKFYFNSRNLFLIGFAGLSLYELIKNKGTQLIYRLGFAVFYSLMALHLNTLIDQPEKQTFLLALLHSPIICWFMFGLVFINRQQNEKSPWAGFLRYNGDLLLFSGLIMICWMILFGITVSLLESLDIYFSDQLMLDLLITAAAISPLIASFAIERIPVLANKLIPLIARIFNPILLIVLVIYLIIIMQAGNNIYGERNFLIVFNIILFTVLAVILFSLSNVRGNRYDKFQLTILYLLTLFTCALNLIALSAILYRLFTWGITPNKLAVTGMNLIAFANLIKIGINLFQVKSFNREPESVNHSITSFLPFYATWAIIIVIVFPIIFA